MDFLVENAGKCRIRQFEFDGVIEEEQTAEMLSGKDRPCYKFTDCEEIGEALKQLCRYDEQTDVYGEKTVLAGVSKNYNFYCCVTEMRVKKREDTGIQNW